MTLCKNTTGGAPGFHGTVEICCNDYFRYGNFGGNCIGKPDGVWIDFQPVASCPSSYGTNPPPCTDSDHGKNYTVQGITFGVTAFNKYYPTFGSDHCEGNTLTEYYCADPTSPLLSYETKNYAHGCSNGVFL